MGFWRGLGNIVTFGSFDRNDANRIVVSSENRQEDAKAALEQARIETEEIVARLGQLKSQIFQETIVEFSNVYERLGKVTVGPLKQSSMAKSASTADLEVLDAKKTKVKAAELAAIGVGGVAVGTTAAATTMAAVGLFGAASTGTAIGTLSGVAATNATLAWLGGGTLAAGGAGVAGGLLVLGGVVLAPIAVIGAFFGVNKGKQKLDDAYSYSAEVDMLVEKIKTLIQGLEHLQDGVRLVGKTLVSLNEVAQLLIDQMRGVADRIAKRTFWRKFIVDPVKRIFGQDLLSQAERTTLMDCVNSALLLKQLLDKPLVNEEGAFLNSVLEELVAYEQHISQFEAIMPSK